MRPYEVMLILDSSAEEALVDSTVDHIKQIVTGKDGKVGQVSKWGRRRFAYEMKHRMEGNYTLMEFSAEPVAVAEVDRMLLLSDTVLRHKIVRVPESVAGAKPASPAAAEATPASESIGE